MEPQDRTKVTANGFAGGVNHSVGEWAVSTAATAPGPRRVREWSAGHTGVASAECLVPASNQLKACASRSRLIALLLTIAGAVLGTASAVVLGINVVPCRILATGAVVALAFATFAARAAAPSVVRDWAPAHSVSEALKSDAYCHLSRTRPFRGENRDDIG
jgi:hypothetical protein